MDALNRHSTAKETLIEEALGELALLFNRPEAVMPKVDASRKALLISEKPLVARAPRSVPKFKISPIKPRSKQPSNDRRVVAVAQCALEAQVQTMREVAREMFKKEAIRS